jgi:hypothetical protein
MTQSEDGAKMLRAKAAIVNAFDAVAVEAALRAGVPGWQPRRLEWL